MKKLLMAAIAAFLVVAPVSVVSAVDSAPAVVDVPANGNDSYVQPTTTAVPTTVRIPDTGISTFDSSLRIGAVLLVAGFGALVVARRRRVAAAA